MTTLIFCVFAFFFFLPVIIAVQRDSKSTLGIFAVVMLTSWSVIGWIIALVWALFGATERATRR